MKSRRFFLLVALGCSAASAIAQAKHRIVVEVNSGGRFAYESALGTVKNVKKAFAGQSIDVEIVCLGPGIDLIFSHNNPLTDRVKGLQKDGVKFAACNNTLHARHVGKDRIFPFVTVVDSGAAEVVRKQEAGWSYLKR